MLRCRSMPFPFPVIVGLIVALSTSSRPSRATAPDRTDNPVIHVQRHGHGRPLILIPGLTCSGAVWDDAVARYGKDYECHVVTLGGFAGQPRYEGPFMATARESLLAYVRSRKLDHPVVIGHSLGGTLALEMAIARPEAFAGLVIMDALPFFSAAGDPAATEATARVGMAPLRDMLRAQTKEQFQAFERTSPYIAGLVTGDSARARVREWGIESDPASTGDAMYDIATTDLRDAVAGIHAPVLVLGTWYGMKDMTTRSRVDSLFRAQYARTPVFQFALADSARHFMMLDAPQWTWSRVDAFLAGLPASAAARRHAR